MKDEIYKNRRNRIEKFTFSKEVSQVFDDMIRRSVPGYLENIFMCTDLINEIYNGEGILYDLGCSTAALPISLSEKFNEKPFTYTGIDNSEAMVDKARNNTKNLPEHHNIQFVAGDIREFDFSNAAIFIASYTLQFIPPGEREELVKKIFDRLPPGGTFIMSEKVLEEHIQATEIFKTMHYLLKKDQGYSDIEISQKREAIEEILVPFTVENNLKMLKEAGFASASIFLKKYNFTSFIAIK
ncbi:MAG: carboxy-S-adenosyl-L-methionine synthase CmoA [Leptospirales bacterium]